MANLYYRYNNTTYSIVENSWTSDKLYIRSGNSTHSYGATTTNSNNVTLATSTDNELHGDSSAPTICFRKNGNTYRCLRNAWYIYRYYVAFNGNGNTGGSQSTIYYWPDKGGRATIPSCGFTKSAYSFNKWNTASNGSGTTYSPGNTISSKSNTTLYAIWQRTYDKATGSITGITHRWSSGTGYHYCESYVSYTLSITETGINRSNYELSYTIAASNGLSYTIAWYGDSRTGQIRNASYKTEMDVRATGGNPSAKVYITWYLKNTSTGETLATKSDILSGTWYTSSSSGGGGGGGGE